MRPQVDRFCDPGELAEILGDWMNGPGPLYRKLARALQRAVQDGSLYPDERLPSERGLASVLAVSRATVVNAYDELRGLGIVDSRRGSGTRVVRQPGVSRPGAHVRPGGAAARCRSRPSGQHGRQRRPRQLPAPAIHLPPGRADRGDCPADRRLDRADRPIGRPARGELRPPVSPSSCVTPESS
ncbi:winged helix-turn-helix transcriptional regulator [Actinomadura rudentiformis]|uniref:Winged helix-turn-helix transcriptional regulator n=1 Tax=Actinomadura rudentiformis TaxID=359158 RepID=A0A6H9Y7Q3_9ACTN|nr:winged helix-turn-helix transcriptional regulator [Actinomadura rudentiformis]